MEMMSMSNRLNTVPKAPRIPPIKWSLSGPVRGGRCSDELRDRLLVYQAMRSPT